MCVVVCRLSVCRVHANYKYNNHYKENNYNNNNTPIVIGQSGWPGQRGFTNRLEYNTLSSPSHNNSNFSTVSQCNLVSVRLNRLSSLSPSTHHSQTQGSDAPFLIDLNEKDVVGLTHSCDSCLVRRQAGVQKNAVKKKKKFKKSAE